VLAPIANRQLASSRAATAHHRVCNEF